MLFCRSVLWFPAGIWEGWPILGCISVLYQCSDLWLELERVVLCCAAHLCFNLFSDMQH